MTGRARTIRSIRDAHLVATLVLLFFLTVCVAFAQDASNEAALEDYVVTAPKISGSLSSLSELRRNSTAVSDVLGAEQMSRSGDSDAASSLRRVTGLTLVKGKYVYVRGLGERYSALTLNGLGLPSPEPSRRVVPLDLFPASMLESVVVQKSFSADMPGEFGGGLIGLKTRSLPDKISVKASVGSSSDMFKDRLAYRGGTRDFLGYDDGTRALPGGIRTALASGRKLNENNPPSFTQGYSAQELAGFGRSLSNSYNITSQSGLMLPSLSLSAASPYQWGNVGFGLAASGLHSSSGEDNEVSSLKLDASGDGQLLTDEIGTSRESESERKSGVSVDFGAHYKRRQRLQASVLLLRHASDEVKVKEALRTDGTRRRTSSLEWTERQLLTRQLSGQHEIFGEGERAATVHWRVQRADASRLSPDAREYTYFQREAGAPWSLGLDVTGNKRVWSEMEERGNEAALDLSLPTPDTAVGRFKIKAGGLYADRQRRSDTWRLHMRNRMGNTPSVDITQDPEKIFAPENIAPDKFVLTNLTESADSYSARQELFAGYASLEWSPVERITWVSGLRFEESRQLVDTFYYFDPEHPTSRAGLRGQDLLPSHSLTWKVSDAWRARLSYGESLARPEFRELSTAPFIDPESGYESVGNASLKGAVIRSLDHRWEYYPSSDESFSVGVFWKKFENPIEEIFEPSPNLRKTYWNAAGAINYGAEIEGRVDLRRITRALRRFTFAANFSLIRSRVDLGANGGLQTSQERPLQGQSPWTANAQLFYDRPAWGTQLGLLYNVVGPRITEVGTSGRPDVYEQAFHELNFVARQKLPADLELSLRFRNLIDPLARSTQGDQDVRSYRKGRSIHVSLSAVF